MDKIIIAGIGTDVGKTIVSSIIMTMEQADYWKPIQTGPEAYSDPKEVSRLVDTSKHTIHKPTYSLKSPLSPHHAARLEHISIDPKRISVPHTTRPLVIETVGGIFVPITSNSLSFDLFSAWNGSWIIVSRHYLGSINHTLLTVEALKSRKVPVLGIVFNGKPNHDTEQAIFNTTQLPLLGRVLPEKHFNRDIIQRYAKQWTRLKKI